jgi:predicted RecB family nuclease
MAGKAGNVMAPDDPITPELVAAYWLCQRKAFLLLRGDAGDPPHEYLALLDAYASMSLKNYLDSLAANGFKIRPYGNQGDFQDADVITSYTFEADDMKVKVDALVRIQHGPLEERGYYVSHLVVGTQAITKDQKVRLAAIGYALAKALNYHRVDGFIVNASGDVSHIQLSRLNTQLRRIIDTLRIWKANIPSPAPPIILKDHCRICPFRKACLAEAEKEDNLTLLDHMTPKVMRKYHKKGIFTVNQLSYLFRPRRQRRRRAHAPIRFKLELQAMALRTAKIYIDQPPSIPVNPTELFLDIEGIPDHGSYYLIGLVISTPGSLEGHSLWADSPDDDRNIFSTLLHIAKEHPDAPIYHYGSYEPKALERIAKKYDLDFDPIRKRLVNVNTLIFGRVYFPTRSNTLKDLGGFVGATWTFPDASGLQSVVWRLRWETSKDGIIKDQLIAYNLEDCHALRLLVAELRNIGQTALTRSDVDFADTPKQNSTTSGRYIHDSLEGILRFAHAEYSKKRVTIRPEDVGDDTKKRRQQSARGHQAYIRAVPPKTKSIIKVAPKRTCPRHKGKSLVQLEKVAEKTIIDLHFTKNGCRKTITKYVGPLSYCRSCGRSHKPPKLRKLGKQLFGRSFQAWVVYQRIILRLPYDVILQVMEDMFNEKATAGTIINFITGFAKYYASTEKMLLKNILASPFVHVDETKINIQGIDHYVWVFTDGIHVVFRLTETRESTLIQDILNGYGGILISDFYAGYESCRCRQQKCMVHLIRDLNDDLWKNPYDSEFESFVGAFKDLLIPIMTDVEKYGLRRRHLNKHKRKVKIFYKRAVDGVLYQGEVTQKYQKRFIRNRESLFRFLDEDGIPWNNNMAERASRHLAIQRKISGSFFKKIAVQYLRLLGIAQTCRFQKKSFLNFLMSGGKDIDQFKQRRPLKTSKPVPPKHFDGNDHLLCLNGN